MAVSNQEWRKERCTKQITPFLPPSLFRDVKQFADDNDVSFSEVVRASLALFLSTYSIKGKQKFISDGQKRANSQKGKRAETA
jgi:hypothetical protein